MIPPRVIGWGVLALALVGAGIWFKGVLAERDALAVQLATITKTAEAESIRLEAERNELQTRANLAAAELAELKARPPAVRTRVVRVPAGVCEPAPGGPPTPGAGGPPGGVEAPPDRLDPARPACVSTARELAEFQSRANRLIAHCQAQQESHRKLWELAVASPCFREQSEDPD